jgi:hypothetical protein
VVALPEDKRTDRRSNQESRYSIYITLGFTKVSIFRPSLILLEEGEKREVARGGEGFGRRVMGWFGNPNSMCCPATVIAQVMADKGKKGDGGAVKIYENSDIHKNAEGM